MNSVLSVTPIGFQQETLQEKIYYCSMAYCSLPFFRETEQVFNASKNTFAKSNPSYRDKETEIQVENLEKMPRKLSI